ncbi:hypothetical protein KSP40_PGU003858 [Platanthera guangdongensis]|uniref:Uncharacterized protein n=1 Tax=Platanthera guangdongensis TaxID=2320717 RepID=A0ABR2LN00_9ASPA
MTNKERTTITMMKLGQQTTARVQVFVETPLQLHKSRVTAMGGAVFEKARLSHQLQEVVNLNENGQAIGFGALTDRQDAEGSVLRREGQEQTVWGSGSTRSQYKYRDGTTCYLRTLTAVEGIVKADTTSASCTSVMAEEA